MNNLRKHFLPLIGFVAVILCICGTKVNAWCPPPDCCVPPGTWASCTGSGSFFEGHEEENFSMSVLINYTGWCEETMTFGNILQTIVVPIGAHPIVGESLKVVNEIGVPSSTYKEEVVSQGETKTIIWSNVGEFAPRAVLVTIKAGLEPAGGELPQVAGAIDFAFDFPSCTIDVLAYDSWF